MIAELLRFDGWASGTFSGTWQVVPGSGRGELSAISGGGEVPGDHVDSATTQVTRTGQVACDEPRCSARRDDGLVDELLVDLPAFRVRVRIGGLVGFLFREEPVLLGVPPHFLDALAQLFEFFFARFCHLVVLPEDAAR
jgi:hypothetical protein